MKLLTKKAEEELVRQITKKVEREIAEKAEQEAQEKLPRYVIKSQYNVEKNTTEYLLQDKSLVATHVAYFGTEVKYKYTVVYRTLYTSPSKKQCEIRLKQLTSQQAA